MTPIQTPGHHMVTLTRPQIVTPTYVGPERRRHPARISDSQFDELASAAAERVTDSEYLRRIGKRVDDLDANLTERLLTVDARLERGDIRMSTIAAQLDETVASMAETRLELAANSATTQQIAVATQDIREILETGKAFFRVATLVGKAARGLGGIAAAGLAIWGAVYAITHGRPWGK